jgi:hypothetical protein
MKLTKKLVASVVLSASLITSLSVGGAMTAQAKVVEPDRGSGFVYDHTKKLPNGASVKVYYKKKKGKVVRVKENWFDKNGNYTHSREYTP